MRLIKIIYDDDMRRPDLSALAADCVDIWHLSGDGGRKFTEVVASPGAVETILAALRVQWGRDADYRVVVLPIEALEPEVQSKSSRLSREEILADLLPSVEISPIYVSLVVLSTIVACVGLLRGDIAILVGAMVLAPLLSPNVCLALASTLADGSLTKKAALANGVGFGLAIAISAVVGLIVDPSPDLPQLAARTHIDYADLVLALAAGVAATLTVTTGLGSALVGVMVAVAILPPTAGMAMLAGAGHWTEAGQTGILLLANLVCVNLAGVVTFSVQGVRPSMWWDDAAAVRARAIAFAIWLSLLAGLIAIIWLRV